MADQTIADRYELEQPLGGGAMSAVWLARDAELERRVAVKVLAHDADRARFEREARAVAGLSHPNICQLYDYGEAEQGPYMILEYLPGGSLEDRFRGTTPLPDDDAAAIAHDVAAGLAHAHERGLVHRDLKPANILFDGEGRAKIADFGIARIAGAGALTQAGTVMGTAAYISPEQAAGRVATPASDVYSFGAILFRMLTGRPPFSSDSAMELVRLHRDEEPSPVERYRPDAPAALASLAFSALAKDPGDRPPDGSALLAELAGARDATTLAAAAPTAVLGGAATAATQVIPAPRPVRDRRSAGVPLVAGAAALLAIAGGATAFVLVGNGSGGGCSSPPSLRLPTVSPGATTGRSSTAETASTESTSSQTSDTTTTQPTISGAAPTAPTTTAQQTTAPLQTTAPPPSTTAPADTTTAAATATTTATDTTTAAAGATTTTGTTP